MSGLLDNPITIVTVLLCIVIIYYSLKYTNKDGESFGSLQIVTKPGRSERQKIVSAADKFLSTSEGKPSTAVQKLVPLPNCTSDSRATTNLFQNVGGSHGVGYTTKKDIYMNPIDNCNPNITKNPKNMIPALPKMYNHNKGLRSIDYSERTSIHGMNDLHRCKFNNSNLRPTPKKWLQNYNSNAKCGKPDGWNELVWPSHNYYDLEKSDPLFANSVLVDDEDNLATKLTTYINYIASEDTCAPVTSLLHKDSLSDCYFIKGGSIKNKMGDGPPSVLKRESLPIHLATGGIHPYLEVVSITNDINMGVTREGGGTTIGEIRKLAKLKMNNSMMAIGIIYQLQPGRRPVTDAHQDTYGSGINQNHGYSCTWDGRDKSLPFTDNIGDVDTWKCSKYKVWLLKHQNRRGRLNSNNPNYAIENGVPTFGGDAFDDIESELKDTYITNSEIVSNGKLEDHTITSLVDYKDKAVVLESRDFNSPYQVTPSYLNIEQGYNSQISKSMSMADVSHARWRNCKEECSSHPVNSQMDSWSPPTTDPTKCNSYRIGDRRECTSLSWSPLGVQSAIGYEDSGKEYSMTATTSPTKIHEIVKQFIKIVSVDSNISSIDPTYMIDFSQHATTDENTVTLTHRDKIEYNDGRTNKELGSIPMKHLVGATSSIGVLNISLGVQSNLNYIIKYSMSEPSTTTSKINYMYSITCPNKTVVTLLASIHRGVATNSSVKISVGLSIISIDISKITGDISTIVDGYGGGPTNLYQELATASANYTTSYNELLTNWKSLSNDKYCGEGNGVLEEIDGEMVANCRCATEPPNTTFTCDYDKPTDPNDCCNTPIMTQFKKSISETKLKAAEALVVASEQEVRNDKNEIIRTQDELDSINNRESFYGGSIVIPDERLDDRRASKIQLNDYLSELKIKLSSDQEALLEAEEALLEAEEEYNLKNRLINPPPYPCCCCDIGDASCCSGFPGNRFACTDARCTSVDSAISGCGSCPAPSRAPSQTVKESFTNMDTCAEAINSKVHLGDGCTRKPSDCNMPNKMECEISQSKYNTSSYIKIASNNLKIKDRIIQTISNNAYSDIDGLNRLKINVQIKTGREIDKLRVIYSDQTLEESTALGKCSLHNSEYNTPTPQGNTTDVFLSPGQTEMIVPTGVKSQFYVSKKLKADVVEENTKMVRKYLVRQIYLLDSLPINKLNDGHGGKHDNYTGIYKVDKKIGSFTQLNDIDGPGQSNLLYNITVPSKKLAYKNQTMDTCNKECIAAEDCIGYTLDQKPVAYTQSDVKYYKMGDPAFAKTDENTRYLGSKPRADNGITLSLINKAGIKCPTVNAVEHRGVDAADGAM